MFFFYIFFPLPHCVKYTVIGSCKCETMSGLKSPHQHKLISATENTSPEMSQQ